ncbi:MAG: peptidoglycan DD-metalloendopeptidase family protein [Xanthomonadaceae bacterium]|jgi:murein DD-endopeptidase MepM/ murein hydrolase activator NlpD|nr:peptidoglycan DD-metalloendopeptidase family protein [Xanthomonadaceae bacterium]
MAYKYVLTRICNDDARSLSGQLRHFAQCRPAIFLGIVLGIGTALGIGGSAVFGNVEAAHLRSELREQRQQLEQVKQASQLEVNALAARLGELQAQANRLNALGERLTRAGQLEDGEFDFQRPPGQGGPESAQDMPLNGLTEGLEQLERRFGLSEQQLSVMDALLFDRQLDRNAVPSRSPVRSSYITSGFGYRADPFGRGGQYHRGIDFDANVGDPVMAVADGVISASGSRNGYGLTVDIDHGNGYVTRYAHNSRLLVSEGDLVRAGQEIAKAGSTGRSTGAHVHLEVWENGSVVNPRKFLQDSLSPPVAKPGRG